ncbi:helix-turn-helix domain-containing protein [Neosynechococcus sphagnicola]|uniref:helix-turn-helix domain-containing protein n=1 Tax=Neosynechococcus sphagnicola TaxID=1501145 RepID=UPI00068FDF22|nr:transposase [Neosynechococcus sphagnicola]
MDIREKIVSAYEAGNTSIRKVAKRFMVRKGVVTRLLHQQKTTGDLSPKPATGGKASQLAPHQAEIIDMVNQYPDWTLEEYCEHWQELSGRRLSASAMCRFLSRQNLSPKKNTAQRPSRYRIGSAATA